MCFFGPLWYNGSIIYGVKMGRNFYFFRHGQTNENAEGAKEGNRTDTYLTADGVKQAEQLAGFLRDKKIDVFYSSPLPRAVRTAEIVGEYHSAAPIVIEDDFIEAAFGFWYNDDMDAQRRIDNNFKRISGALGRIVAQNKYSDIAISSHGGVTRALCWAAGMRVGHIKNCQCFHFTLDDDGWHFVEVFESGIEVVNKSDIGQM